jgi:ribonuclease P protein component
MTKINTFTKEERLKSAIRIKEVYTSGAQYFTYPFKLYLLKKDVETMHHSLCVSVPKRNFKAASDRNQLKRRGREIYRLNKSIISYTSDKFDMYWVYIGKKVEPYSVIEKGMIKLLRQIV